MTDEVSKRAHLPREQQRSISAGAGMGMNVFKPIMQFQVSMLRMLADSIEGLAGKYEKGFEESTNTIEEQLRKSVSP